MWIATAVLRRSQHADILNIIRELQSCATAEETCSTAIQRGIARVISTTVTSAYSGVLGAR